MRWAAAGSAISASRSATSSSACPPRRPRAPGCRRSPSRSTTTSCASTPAAVVVRGARDPERAGRAGRAARAAGGPAAPRAAPVRRSARSLRRRPAPLGCGRAWRSAVRAHSRRRALPGEPHAMRIEGPFEGDPLDAFADGLAVQPAPRSAARRPMGRDGRSELHPELFLRRRGRDVVTAPIKGTTAATPTSDGAAARARRLGEGPRRERDDRRPHAQRPRPRLRVRQRARGAPRRSPSRIPASGTSSPSVRGRLRDDVGDGELLRATFPPGSVTGAPKVQALHVIAELEGAARDVYTGAIGFASPVAGLELNVAIRTFEVARRARVARRRRRHRGGLATRTPRSPRRSARRARSSRRSGPSCGPRRRAVAPPPAAAGAARARPRPDPRSA